MISIIIAIREQYPLSEAWNINLTPIPGDSRMSGPKETGNPAAVNCGRKKSNTGLQNLSASQLPVTESLLAP